MSKGPLTYNNLSIPSSLLIECMQDEVWYADTSGHFILATPCACEAFALPNVNNLDIQEFAASLEVLRPDGTPRPINEAPPLRALQEKTVIEQEEIVRLPKSGQLRYRLVTSSPVKDATGTIIGCVSVVHDITDKIHHEREREKETARLKILVSILQHQSESIQDFLNYTLDQAIRLSNSKIGYIYH